VIERLRTTESYSTAVADWQRFSVDYRQDPAEHLDKDQLLEVLRRYARYHRLDMDWKSLSTLDLETLVNALITNLPLGSASKQALVESVGIAERRDLLLAILARDPGSHEKPMTH
jgi:Lon protease-like protein